MITVSKLFVWGVIGSILLGWTFWAEAKESRPGGLYLHEGKWFTGPQDPEYKEYESVLKARMKERIQKRFGVELSPDAYSGFDLLEIESLLKVRRPDESPDQLFMRFPRTP